MVDVGGVGIGIRIGDGCGSGDWWCACSRSLLVAICGGDRQPSDKGLTQLDGMRFLEDKELVGLASGFGRSCGELKQATEELGVRKGTSADEGSLVKVRRGLTSKVR